MVSEGVGDLDQIGSLAYQQVLIVGIAFSHGRRAPAGRFRSPPAPDRGVCGWPPNWLHGERAIAIASSFQLTKTIRLDLTH
jgi:hypothetical protein